MGSFKSAGKALCRSIFTYLYTEVYSLSPKGQKSTYLEVCIAVCTEWNHEIDLSRNEFNTYFPRIVETLDLYDNVLFPMASV